MGNDDNNYNEYSPKDNEATKTTALISRHPAIDYNRQRHYNSQNFAKLQIIETVVVIVVRSFLSDSAGSSERI